MLSLDDLRSHEAPESEIAVHDPLNRPTSRRQFLRSTLAGLGGLAAASLLGRELLAEDDVAGEPPAPSPAPAAATETAAEVFEIHEPRLLDGDGNVRERDYLPGVVHRLLRKATGQARTRNAWRALFKPDDVIGILFDPIGAEELRTAAPLTRMLVESLTVQGGIPAKQILLIHRPPLTDLYGTRPLPLGYQAKALAVTGKHTTHLMKALEPVTALLNVPFVKDHRVLGLSSAVVNLTLRQVSNPDLFVNGDGEPGPEDLLAVEAIRSRHRLTLTNAIRGIYDGGPRAHEGRMWTQASLMAATDPVAADRIALDMLDAARHSRGLKPVDEAGRPAGYLARCQAMGLGVADLSRIKRHPLSI